MIAADKDEDVTQTLLRVRHTFGEVVPNIEKSPFNPLVPSDLDELDHKLTPKVRGIIASASGSSGKQASGVEGYMIPILEKPLTRILRERDQLAKRFGIVAVDVLRHANGKRSVAEISIELKVEQTKAEDILALAHRLGIVEFKLKVN